MEPKKPITVPLLVQRLPRLLWHVPEKPQNLATTASPFQMLALIQTEIGDMHFDLTKTICLSVFCIKASKESVNLVAIGNQCPIHPPDNSFHRHIICWEGLKDP